jgi:dTDP-4-amino-4,6-dideoxygalactose transaminase
MVAEFEKSLCEYTGARHAVAVNSGRAALHAAASVGGIGRGDAENIGVNVHYIPIPWMTHYANLGYAKGQWPIAEAEYERMLSLPCMQA